MISRNIGTDKCAHCSRSETEAHHPDCPEHSANKAKRFEADAKTAAIEYADRRGDDPTDLTLSDVAGGFLAGIRWAAERKS